ncbi:PREDICTED: inducible metalloproteinase inhibitor protein-like [Nicrophorus vespilloides]|uniref:Inducible metalloproteinase inhibitor protein-like n=1 Tax=Nicrophorus vespilloides TaxID=110193 RepID=A0ABM1MH35_NICVS|nr:PREDICTED: inducible metalloproteinase inhibitor protein-like [Nicrophorus vespilloides]
MALKTSVVIAAICVMQTIAFQSPKDCFRPNEVYLCNGACQITCTNYNKPCLIANIVCNDWCYCKKGYARDQTGNCVAIAKCADRLNGICGENEENRVDFYLHDTCHEQLLNSWEIESGDRMGCYCIAGYKRDPSGKCIPAAECPPKPPAKYPNSKS